MIKIIALSMALSGAFAQPLTAGEWRIIDGDTLQVPRDQVAKIISGLDLHIRLRGVDTPELKGKCRAEIRAAQQAATFTADSLKRAKKIEIGSIEWDKYGGRVDADLFLDGKSLGKMLIDRGLARPYNGGTRGGWCK